MYAGDRPWRAQEGSKQYSVWHVKWHSGLITNLRDRAAYYRCTDVAKGNICCLAKFVRRYSQSPQEPTDAAAGSSAASHRGVYMLCRGDCVYDTQGMQMCTPRHADWRQAIEAFYMVGGTPAVEGLVPCENGTLNANPFLGP